MRWIGMVLLMCVSGWTQANVPPPDCPSSDVAVTTPAPVNPTAVYELIVALQRLPQKTLATISSPGLRSDIQTTFDTNVIKTKMEQFYTLLYVIAQHLEPVEGKRYLLDPEGVRAILLASGVFSDPSVPAQITAVEIDLSHSIKPTYRITFAKKGVTIQLNQGKGFYVFKSGKCQHATHLVFDQAFSVGIKKNRKAHIVASDFRGVNLVGDFGNRGIVDVDINYVSLKSVEFYKGTQNGKVTAYVSEEEFRKNKHSNLLRIISKFVPDRSVQPIDW